MFNSTFLTINSTSFITQYWSASAYLEFEFLDTYFIVIINFSNEKAVHFEKADTSPNSMSAPVQDSRESSPAEDEVILATAGYDHCIKFWTAHTGTIKK